MDVSAELENLERERLDLLEQAARIVEWAQLEWWPYTDQEDAMVLGLMVRVRCLEKKIGRLKRRQNIGGKEQEQRR